MNVQASTPRRALPAFRISPPKTSACVREISVDGTVIARLFMPDIPDELTDGTERLYVWLGVTLVRPAHVCEPNVVDAIQSLLSESGVGAHYGIDDLEALATELADAAFPRSRFTLRSGAEPNWRVER